MKRVAVVAYSDADVYKGLFGLVDKLDEKVMVLLPVTSHKDFVLSALKVIKEKDLPFNLYLTELTDLFNLTDDASFFLDKAEDVRICVVPTKEMLNDIQIGDEFAIVWDNSYQALKTIGSIEDFGLSMWSIATDDPEPIIIEDDQDIHGALYEDLQDAFNTFLDTFMAYVTTNTVQVLKEAIMDEILQRESEEIDFGLFDDLDEED
jgi:hypothetical protein